MEYFWKDIEEIGSSGYFLGRGSGRILYYVLKLFFNKLFFNYFI